ncbi:hypothetical protein FG379_000607 [Cryptosporidium bovis]|uniref:uncharacterized protein n=1 Tax=Cryptosporidium bovis TaxID=310047 RepID=UPI00351A1444|nr:hypothetical protein FG379_000607 [Cryptosporidium bovis]
MQPHKNEDECMLHERMEKAKKIDTDEIYQVFGENELEKDHFCLEYVNSKFPDEHSLSNIENIIKELQLEEKNIDKEIEFDLKELCSSNTIGDFVNYLVEIENSLIPNIKLIDKHGKSSLNNIEYMLNNLQRLDEQQSNLIGAKKLLEEVYVYILVLEEMKKYVKIRDYSEVILLLVLEHYQQSKLTDSIDDVNLSKVIRFELSNAGLGEHKVFELIKKTIAEYEALKKTFKEQIMDDFMSLIDPCVLFLNIIGDEKNDELIKTNTVITPPQYLEAPEKYITQMRSCCYCVDLVGGFEFRNEIINKFSERLLEPYNKLFGTIHHNNMNRRNKVVINGDKASISNTFGLELLERRFSWYKRFMKEYEQQFGEIFLTTWEIMTVLTEKYFIYTRKHIMEVLGDNGNNIDYSFIIKYSLLCHQFECYVISKFVQVYDQNMLMCELEEYKSDGSFVNNSNIYNLKNHVIRNYYESNEVEIRKTIFNDRSNGGLFLFQSPFLASFENKDSEMEFSKSVYPNIRNLLTECFIPYLTSYFDAKKELLRKKMKELTANDNMMENSQIKKEIYMLSNNETIPLIWNSCMELFKLINTLFIEIKHLLSYDDVYFQFNSLIMQMCSFYLNIITQTCNIQINGITEKCVQLKNMSSGINSLENFVETVVSTVSNQTSKVVAAATTGIGEASIITGETGNSNNAPQSNKYIGNGSSMIMSNIFGSGGSIFKYDPKKIGATLGSIDYMEWMYDRLDKMVMKERNKMIIEQEGSNESCEFRNEINLNGNEDNMNDESHNYITNHNIMFNNNMWVIRRVILKSIIKDIMRSVAPIMADWYTKKMQKYNDTLLNNCKSGKTRNFSVVNAISDSNLTGISSLTDNLYDILLGTKNNNKENSYFQYIKYIADIYKYKVINQTMVQVLTDSLGHINNFFKGQKVDDAVVNILSQEINKLSLLFLELPSYYPNIYIPKAYVGTINKLTNKSLKYINLRDIYAFNGDNISTTSNTVFNEYKIIHGKTNCSGGQTGGNK